MQHPWQRKARFCPICGKLLSCSSSLRVHMRIHTGDRPYECSYCERRFTQSVSKILHERRKHTGEMPFSCSCGRRFIDRSSFKRHFKKHIGLKKFGIVRNLNDNQSSSTVSDTQSHKDDTELSQDLIPTGNQGSHENLSLTQAQSPAHQSNLHAQGSPSTAPRTHPMWEGNPDGQLQASASQSPSPRNYTITSSFQNTTTWGDDTTPDYQSLASSPTQANQRYPPRSLSEAQQPKAQLTVNPNGQLQAGASQSPSPNVVSFTYPTTSSNYQPWPSPPSPAHQQLPQRSLQEAQQPNDQWRGHPNGQLQASASQSPSHNVVSFPYTTTPDIYKSPGYQSWPSTPLPAHQQLPQRSLQEAQQLKSEIDPPRNRSRSGYSSPHLATRFPLWHPPNSQMKRENRASYPNVNSDDLGAMDDVQFVSHVEGKDSAAPGKDSKKEILAIPDNRFTAAGLSGGSANTSNVSAFQEIHGNININPPVKKEDVRVSASLQETDDDSAALISLSVRALDGCTSVELTYQNGEVTDLIYGHGEDTEHDFRTRWTFKNVKKGLVISVMGKSAMEFAKLVETLEDLYECKLYKVYNKCLVLEFLHESEEKAQAMINDQKIVKKLFTKFLNDTGNDSPDCTLEVSCDKPLPKSESRRRKQELHLPSSSRQAGPISIKQEMVPGLRRGLFKKDIIKEDGPIKSTESSPTAATQDISDEPMVKKRMLSLDKAKECGKCKTILEQFRTDSVTEGNIFIFHLPNEIIHNPEDKIIQPQKTSFDFLKRMSSLRNTEGGVLLVHLDCERENEITEDGFMSFANRMFNKVIAHNEVPCDTVNVEPDELNKDVYILRTEPCEKLITVDYKTKIPGPTTYWCEDTTPEKLMPFLSLKRKVEDKKPMLRGMSVAKQGMDVVKLYCEQPAKTTTVHDLVENIMEVLLLAEHITSCSKRKQGGSIYVGHGIIVKSESIQQGLDMTGFIFDTGYEGKFCHFLQRALEEKLLVYDNPHLESILQAKDVFEIGMHKMDEGFVVEVAVRAVNGCVFYDPKGPEAYTIENGEIQRIRFDKWIDKIVKG